MVSNMSAHDENRRRGLTPRIALGMVAGLLIVGVVAIVVGWNGNPWYARSINAANAPLPTSSRADGASLVPTPIIIGAVAVPTVASPTGSPVPTEPATPEPKLTPPVVAATPGPPSPVPSPSSTIVATSTASPQNRPIPTATVAATPPARPATHVIQPGETLTSIARQYGVTVQQLLGLNHITDPNTIYSGTVLQIP